MGDLNSYLTDLSQNALAGSGSSAAVNAPSSVFGEVNDLFKTLGGYYVQTVAIEKANPAAYSQYAWNAATGNTNGALQQPYVQTVAQQQQVANQSRMSSGINPLFIYAALGFVAFLVIKKV